MIALALLIGALAAFYLYYTRNFDYWEKRGVKYEKPIVLFGTQWKTFTMQESLSEAFTHVYNKYPEEKIVGGFHSTKPQLIIRDPEIVKRVLITDFPHFYPRGLLYGHPRVEPLLRNLFFADGDLWKLLRARMSPAFSSGKLRAMFPLIAERAERLRARAQPAAAARRPLDARDLMARYTTDFIGAVAFGLDADSLRDDRSAFRMIGAKFFKINVFEFILGMMKNLFPRIFQNYSLMARVEKDMLQLVDQILKNRNYEPTERNDFVDLLLECRKKGTIVGESIEKLKSDGTPERATLEMDLELIAAQVFVFFAAGFETSSSATSFTLLQLAYHQDVQARAQAEVDKVLAQYDNRLCYDAVKDMKYLEWCFKEGLRMFPSLGFLIRRCARTYTIPEAGVTVDPGVAMVIPLQALHNDPQYFPEPEVFRPERFDPEHFDPGNKYVYLPFGDGPRACIGARMGLMQSVAGLAAVLSRFTVRPAPATERRRGPALRDRADTQARHTAALRGQERARACPRALNTAHLLDCVPKLRTPCDLVVSVEKKRGCRMHLGVINFEKTLNEAIITKLMGRLW